MVYSEPERVAVRRDRSASSEVGITVYGCDPAEAALFRETASRLGVRLTLAEEAVSESTVELAAGHRCISVGHKENIANSTLLALSRAGVVYISTRSIGYNHIDVSFAESVGILVENVAYSPDSVADFTLMLMLMALRDAKSIVGRAAVHDYRLSDVPGRELRDLTVGVVGTGRIGAAVIDRLWGFGCQTLAFDILPRTSADYVSLDDLLEQSDIVTLHTPLTTETRHLLDRRRIERMKHGAFVVNTGRGGLVDTEALVSAVESGRLGGAALDVLEGEEGVFYTDCRGTFVRSPLLERVRTMPNVVISPHTAYYTDHALRDAVENSIVNCVNFESERWHG